MTARPPPTSTGEMSEAEFPSNTNKCPENPGKTKSDHTQNNLSKSNNNETQVKTEPCFARTG